MNSQFEQNFAAFFPLLFAALWLTITTILAALSGWFRLTARFPNQTEEPLLRPPIIVAILFPAIVFGVVAIAKYVREKN